MRWKRKSGGESEVTRISSGYWERESFSVFFSICFTCSQTDCRLCGEALTVQQVRDKRGEATRDGRGDALRACLPGNLFSRSHLSCLFGLLFPPPYKVFSHTSALKTKPYSKTRKVTLPRSLS